MLFTITDKISFFIQWFKVIREKKIVYNIFIIADTQPPGSKHTPNSGTQHSTYTNSLACSKLISLGSLYLLSE